MGEGACAASTGIGGEGWGAKSRPRKSSWHHDAGENGGAGIAASRGVGMAAIAGMGAALSPFLAGMVERGSGE